MADIEKMNPDGNEEIKMADEEIEATEEVNPDDAEAVDEDETAED